MLNFIRVLLICLTCILSKVSSADPHQHIKKTENVKLGFINGSDITYSTVRTHSSAVMCVFDSWSTKPEQKQGMFAVGDIDTTLCTHLVFRLAEIEKDARSGGKFAVKDIDSANSAELYKEIVGLKKNNPKLKVMLSIGGWAEGVSDFQAISSDQAALSSFTETVVNFLKVKEFDGLNIEWNWPGVAYRGGVPEDKKRVVDLIDSLSEKFRGNNLEVAITLPARIHEIEGGYDLHSLNETVDYFIVMGQDFAGSWGTKTGHHSPLCGKIDNTMTVGAAVKFISSMVDPSKLILGIPFAGKSFKLVNRDIAGNAFGADSVQNAGHSHEFNTDDKVVNYPKICSELKIHKSWWEVYYDEEARVPFMKMTGGGNEGGLWFSYDDTKSVGEKVKFGNYLGLGGYAAWPMNTDDFRGDYCSDEPQSMKIQYPLLRTINHVLSMNKTLRFTREAIEDCVGPLPPGFMDKDKSRSMLETSSTTKYTASTSTMKPPTATDGKKNAVESRNDKNSGNSVRYFIPGIPALVIMCVIQF